MDEPMQHSSSGLVYKLSGTGNIRILFTMGLGGSLEQWEPQLNYFSQQLDVYTTCAYDNRGVGLSHSPPGRWTTKDMAKDTIKLLDDLGWHSDVCSIVINTTCLHCK